MAERKTDTEIRREELHREITRQIRILRYRELGSVDRETVRDATRTLELAEDLSEIEA